MSYSTVVSVVTIPPGREPTQTPGQFIKSCQASSSRPVDKPCVPYGSPARSFNMLPRRPPPPHSGSQTGFLVLVLPNVNTYHVRGWFYKPSIYILLGGSLPWLYGRVRECYKSHFGGLHMNPSSVAALQK